MFIVNFAIFVSVLGVSFACFYKNREWAMSLHRYYINESKKHWYGKLFPWENPRLVLLFRIMVIFFGIIFLIVAYPLAFGTVYF